MFVSLVSHLLCAWFAFVLPSYSTYKALAHPAPAHTLPALSAYWAVIGAFTAFEQTFGLFLSWLPFYWELRTIFLLYLSLPQTQGSAYVYKTFMEPWCLKNEADLDAAMTSVQTNAIAFCRTRIAALVDLFWSFVNKNPSSAQPGDAHKPDRPFAAPVDQLKGLWTAFGPSVVAAFAPKDTSATSSREEAHKPYSAN